MDREWLLAAGDRNLAEVLRRIARGALAGELHEDEGLLLVSASRHWPGPYHNGALRLDPSLPPTEVLERAEAFFADRCPGYCVWIAAHADFDLEQEALAAGLVAISAIGTPRMVADEVSPVERVPSGVSLEEVVDEGGRIAYLAVTVDAYAESPLPADAAEAQLATLASLRGPGVRAVVARERGRAVAAAMVVVSDAVAGIQLVGTVPDARRRGLAELCTRWAANTGFALGASAAVLEASEAGEPLYRRMGFVEISRYRWCLGPPPVGRAGTIAD